MGARVQTFVALVPAGTPVATPAVVALRFDPGYLEHVEVVIPPGHLGLTGFYLAYGGQQLIPDTAGQWLIGNDDKFSADPDYAMVGQQWQLVGYNTDINDHRFYVRCYVREIGGASQTAGAGPDVLPLSIVAEQTGDVGTVDLTGPPDLAAPVLPDLPPLDLTDTVTPLDLPADTEVTPLDIPADAPAVEDAPVPDDAPAVEEE